MFGAAAITIIGFGLSIVIRMGNNLALSYLLVPELFGLMALANVVLQGVQMCSDVGIGPCLVQHARAEEPVFNNTAWTIQLVRGMGIWALLAAISHPLALFYEEPRLQWVIIALGFTALLQAAASTSVHLARRHLQIGRLTLLEVGTQLLGALSMSLMAYYRPDEWSLVFGTIFSTGVYVILTHIALGRVRNRFAWDRDSANVLMNFGKWIIVGMLISFLALQIDRMLLGKIGTFTDLGVYHLAISIAMLGPLTMEKLSMSVQFPLLSEAVRKSPEIFRSKLFQSRAMLLDTGQLLTLGVFVISPLFFGLLYHNNYSEAGTIAQILCFPTWCAVLSKTIDRSLLALGDTRCLAIAAFAGLVVGTIASATGFWLYGLYGFCFGVGFGALGSHLCLYPLLRRHGIRCGLQDLRESMVILSVALCIFLLQRSEPIQQAFQETGLSIPMPGHLVAVGLYMVFASVKGLQIYRLIRYRNALAPVTIP